MTKAHRMVAIAIAGVMLLSGFVFGRMSDTPKTTAAEENKAAVSQLTQTSSTQAAKESETFYLSDFKTGYSDGYNAGVDRGTSNVVSTARAGYNDGFKQGYADGFQEQVSPAVAGVSSNSRPTIARNRLAQQEVVYQPSTVRKRNSTLKTVLTIAAPAAIGAGVGAAVGGKKGAGVGALLGGGGGAIYHLIKNRN